MSTLSSTSTLAEINAAYDDNASYASNGSLAQARTFVLAIRLLLRRQPMQAGKDGESLQTTIALLQQEKKEAENWISVKEAVVSSSGGVQRLGFRGFRT